MEYGILMAADSEVDFMIHGLFSYKFFGQTVWITTSHMCILLVMLLLLAFSIAANRKIRHATEVPDTFQNIVELVVEKLYGMVENAMGHNAKYFANYIGTIFCFILLSNISGLLGNLSKWYLVFSSGIYSPPLYKLYHTYVGLSIQNLY